MQLSQESCIYLNRYLHIALLALGTTPAIAVDFMNVDGRLVNLSLRAPTNPTDRHDCDAYRTESATVLQAINDAHGTCLKGHPHGPGENHCSSQACERLHEARESAQRNMSNGYNACVASVKRRNRQTNTEVMGEFATKLIEGPKSAIDTIAHNAMTDALAEHFSAFESLPKLKTDSPAQVASSQVAELTGAVGKVLIECDRKAVTADARNRCAQSVRHSLNDWSLLHVPLSLKGDPAVLLIQRAMLEKLVQIQDDALHQLNVATTDIEQLSPSGHGNSSTASRAMRGTALAECAKLDSSSRTDFANDHPDEFEALIARCAR